jgi:hypothetical protein
MACSRMNLTFTFIFIYSPTLYLNFSNAAFLLKENVGNQKWFSAGIVAPWYTRFTESHNGVLIRPYPDQKKKTWKNHRVQTGPPSFWRWHTLVHVTVMFLSEWREFATTISITSYDIGKQVGLRTYQRPCNIKSTRQKFNFMNLDITLIKELSQWIPYRTRSRYISSQHCDVIFSLSLSLSLSLSPCKNKI